jgi:hypothetical protein
MRNITFALVLALLAGCGVSKQEAQVTLEGIESIARAPADVRLDLLGRLCVVSPGCAGDCEPVLKTLGSVDAKDRMLLISQCDAAVKPLPETDGRKAFVAWLAKRVGAYVTKVREALPEAERARLDKAWTTAGAID